MRSHRCGSPGWLLLYGVVLAGFMIPVQSLVVSRFIFMDDIGLVNSWAGDHFAVVDRPDRDCRLQAGLRCRSQGDAGGGGARWRWRDTLLCRLYLLLNWGITSALAMTAFISAWHRFLWPFVIVTAEDRMCLASPAPA